MPSFRLAASLVALGIILVGCSGDTTPSGPGETPETSTIAGVLAATDGRTGRLTLTSDSPALEVTGAPELGVSPGTAAALAVISLTGTVEISDGTTASLTATWNTDTGDLAVSGGGFVLGGVISNGVLSGSFTGPSISGLFSVQVGAPSDIAVYCGTFNGRQPEDLPDGQSGTAPSNGTWNLVVGASAVQLIAVGGQDATLIVLSGTHSGNAVTLSVPGGSATGTIRGASNEFVNGTYATDEGEAGAFHGSEAACTATSETATIAQLIINPPGLLPGDARVAFDSTLAFVTALDADGNYVAAPDLAWTFPANDDFIRTNAEPTLPGQKWVVLQSPQGPGSVGPPELATRTFSVASRNQPTVTATGTVVIYWYW